jgi:hypothetical protein
MADRKELVQSAEERSMWSTSARLSAREVRQQCYNNDL